MALEIEEDRKVSLIMDNQDVDLTHCCSIPQGMANTGCPM